MFDTYDVEKIVDLVHVPANKLDACLQDVKLYIDHLQKSHPVPGVIQRGITWVDDGKHDFLGKIIIPNENS